MKVMLATFLVECLAGVRNVHHIYGSDISKERKRPGQQWEFIIYLAFLARLEDFSLIFFGIILVHITGTTQYILVTGTDVSFLPHIRVGFTGALVALSDKCYISVAISEYVLEAQRLSNSAE